MAWILASGGWTLAVEREGERLGERLAEPAGAVAVSAMGYRARIRAAAAASTVYGLIVFPALIVSLSGLSVLPLCPAFPLGAWSPAEPSGARRPRVVHR